MRQVIPNRLWIGNARDARAARDILKAEIAAVVDLALEEPAAELPRDLIHCRIPLLDGEGNSDAVLWLAVQTVYQLIRAAVPTLVACSGGMSRSPAITALALSKLHGRAAAAVLEEITDQAPHDISSALWSQLNKLNNV